MKKFNVWYDGLPSTTRFLIFIALMLVSVCLLQVGLTLVNPTMILIGLLNTIVVVAIASNRANILGGVHSTMSKVLVGLCVIIALAALAKIYF